MHRRRFKVMSALQCNNHNPDARACFRALSLAFLIIAILICGCSLSSDEQSDPRMTKEGMSMAQTPKNTSSTVPIPPIDAVAYARVETATFALG
jgi:hypothetical protein